MQERLVKAFIILFLILFFSTETIIAIENQLDLTEEEKIYIEKSNVIKASSMEGVAPFHYTDSQGQIKGIAVDILNTISDMTGLKFQYKLYNRVEDVFQSDADIILGISSAYAPEEMILSEPYLKSEVILFINPSIESNELQNKRYAAIKGGKLPDGIKEKNIVYYDSREDALDAVEKGEADYGYGNAYSLAFYTLQNNYKNLLSIPKVREVREYAIGFPKENTTLLSIINKSIASIDESQIQTLILKMTSNIDRKITFPMIMDIYGERIIGIACIVITILSISIVLNIRGKNRFKIQNKRYESLSYISNEYLYEYNIRNQSLILSERIIELFENLEKYDKGVNILKDVLISGYVEESISPIYLPLSNTTVGVFKAINSKICDEKDEIYSIIGKLVDISQEVAERRELIKNAQIDGLTGLYNHITVMEFISEDMKNWHAGQLNAFIIMDCDEFKDINDIYGHLMGDEVLQKIGQALKQVFRTTDIVGRIGGDEFCVYMKDIPSLDFVSSKFCEFNSRLQELNQNFLVSISGGVSFVNTTDNYESLFKRADDALYKVKSKGGGRLWSSK